jgi:hypothetical protein
MTQQDERVTSRSRVESSNSRERERSSSAALAKKRSTPQVGETVNPVQKLLKELIDKEN